MAREKYETLTPLYHNASFNARGQMHDTRLGTTVSGAERGNLTFNYSPNPVNYGNGPGNNGNLLQQNNIIPNSDTFRQDYAYDQLNRLKWVNEYKVTNGTPAHSFKQEFEYDVFGNRTINQATTSNAIPKPNFELEHLPGQTLTHNNRLCAPGDMNLSEPNRLMRYDAAGNLIQDRYAPETANGPGQRNYDAENRMTSAQGVNGAWQYYKYDGDGRRIIRKVNGIDTWQVYGFDGELIAEYSAQFAAFVPQKEYGYEGGKLLITATNGDEQRLTSWVQNLYFHTYGYLPAQSEMQDKVNALATAGSNADPNVFIQTAQAQAESLFASPTYASRDRNNYDYVRDLYAVYLQRPADPGGLAWWASQAANPANRYAVRQAFANPLAEISEGEFVDSEFGARLNDLRGNNASDTARTDQFINYIYFAVLNNSPEGVSVPGYSRSEARELFNLANAKGQAETVTQAKTFVKALFNSSAYNALGKTPEQQFVHDLYIAYLRFEDAPGAAWWTTQVGNNFQNKQAVMDAFANTAAFETQAKTLHREILWLIGDQLTSSRLIAERTGKLEGIKRHDFLPFGEEITAGTGGRTTTQGYNQLTGNREKWATYERDEETGLDYAQARYYAPAQGRFTSPDEFTGGPDELYDFAADAADNPMFYADLNNPQSLNKYQYTYNNPLNMIDPDGHEPCCLLLPTSGSTVSEVAKGVAKELANTAIDISNAGGTMFKGHQDVAPYEPSNKAQAAGMIGTNRLILFGSLASGRSAPATMMAEGKTSATVSARAVATKTYQTYTKTNPTTGKVYVGRTSGKGTPAQNVAKRNAGHKQTKKGYGQAKLDQTSRNRSAIRGREQQMIDKNRSQGRAAEQINGVGPRNKNRQKYMNAATKEFGKP